MTKPAPTAPDLDAHAKDLLATIGARVGDLSPRQRKALIHVLEALATNVARRAEENTHG